MEEPEPIDWQKADAGTQEMRARLAAQEPITAGSGLGMNQRTIENLGEPKSESGDPTTANDSIQVLLAGNGLFIYGNVLFTGELDDL